MFVVFVIFVLFVWDSYRSGLLSPEVLRNLYEQHPFSTIAIFIGIYALSVLVAVPSLPLNLAAGYFWGGFLGGVYATLGVTIGGFVSFLAARYFLGNLLSRSYNSIWLDRVQTEFSRNGWKYIAFVRMNPVIPTGPFNFFLGLTSVSKRTFLWTTAVFLMPPTIAVSFIGDTLQTFNQDGQATDIVRTLLIISGSITFLFVVRFASKIFRKRMV